MPKHLARWFLAALLCLGSMPAQAQLEVAREIRAARDLNDLGAALHRFHQDMGRYPSTQEGLDVLIHPTSELQASGRYPVSAYLSSLPKDPWGNPYHYVQPGVRTDQGYDIWSNGSDGKPGGEGGNEDVGNWSGGPEDYARKARMIRLRGYSFAGLWAAVISLLIFLPIYASRVAARRRGGQGLRRAMLGAELLRLVLAFGLVFVLATWWASLSLYID